MMINNSGMMGFKGSPAQHVAPLPAATRFAIGGQIPLSPMIAERDGPLLSGQPPVKIQACDISASESYNRSRGRSRISGACVTCAAAKKACDEVRPCTRCTPNHYFMTDCLECDVLIYILCSDDLFLGFCVR